MNNDLNVEYNKEISKRIKLILDYTGLEIKGISALTKKSTDIFYAVINGRKPLTKKLANIIGECLEFEGDIIFNINIPIPSSIRYSKKLDVFKKENYNNRDFFKESWTKEKDSTFIKINLINKNYFYEARYAWEVQDKLKSLNRNIDSDLLTKQLKYLVNKGILCSHKTYIKLKNGGYGKRLVEIYYRRESK